MSQGKKYTEEEKHKIIYEDLKEYFVLGQHLARACINGGIPYTTFKTWYDEDESLRIIVEGWRNQKFTKAERTLIESLDDKETPPNVKSENAKFILKTGLKSEYSERQEVTGADGLPLGVDLTKLSDEDLEHLNAIAAKSAADQS